MIRHRALLPSILLALSSAPLVAQSAAPPAASAPPAVARDASAPAPVAAVAAAAPAAPVARPGGESPALLRALDTIRAEKILADIFFVACDDMGGRDTPSVGQRLTARFLKNRLQRIGWKPGAERGWFHTYPVERRKVKEPDTRVTVRRVDATADAPALELEFGKDYWFFSNDLEPLELRAKLVHCGSGSSEDFAAATDLKGRLALCDAPFERAEEIGQSARAAGAVGVVFIVPPAEGDRASRRADFLARRVAGLRRGTVSWPDSERETPRVPVFPRLYVPRATGERLLALAGVAAPKAGTELPLELHDVRALDGDLTVECENVCGFWPGSDPELAKEAIVISAHYDHVGVDGEGRVYNGADDNGSGTCGLLALAEALVEYGPLRRSVLLIWVSGEEKGLWGSGAWAKAPWIPGGGRPIANINIDMIGRNSPTQILLTPTRAHQAYNGLSRLAEATAGIEGFTDVGSADQYYHRSDHANFAKLGIPVTFLFSDVHDDYHRPGDDAEKIDPDKTRRVVRTVLRMLVEMQADELALAN